MERHYYTGSGLENDQLVTHAYVLQKGCDSERRKLCEEYGAAGLYIDQGEVAALIFPKKVNRRYLRTDGKRNAHGMYVYYPKRNTLEGKALAKRMHETAILHFNMSRYLLDTLHLHHSEIGPHKASRTGMALYFSSAGCAGGKVIVQIPGSPDGEGFPQIPEWLHEVSREEWSAILDKGNGKDSAD